MRKYKGSRPSFYLNQLTDSNDKVILKKLRSSTHHIDSYTVFCSIDCKIGGRITFKRLKCKPQIAPLITELFTFPSEMKSPKDLILVVTQSE